MKENLEPYLFFSIIIDKLTYLHQNTKNNYYETSPQSGFNH